jgi:hypothetical protein
MGRFTWMTRAAAVAAGTAAALAIGTTPAHAYKLADGEVELKGLAFVNFTSVDGNPADPGPPALTGSQVDDAASGFHVDRGYFEMRYHPDKKTTYRITLDTKGPDQDYFIKYAYAQIKIAGENSHYVKFGLHHTPVVDYYQSDIWQHRYVAKTFVDDIGVYTSSDLGVSVLGDVGDMFNYYLSFMNGEGYDKTPNGAGYAFEGRVEARAAGARVGLHGMSNSKVAGVDTTDRTVYGVYLAYFADFGDAAAEYVSADDDDKAKYDSGSGYSVLANANIPAGNKSKAFARYDSFEAVDGQPDPVTKVIVGAETEVHKNVMVAVDYQSQDTGTDTINTVAVHAQIKI